MSDTVDHFDGDLGRAAERLRELTEHACSTLSADILNLTSYRLAVYLDRELGQGLQVTDRMTAELKAEQKASNREWRRLRKDLDGGA